MENPELKHYIDEQLAGGTSPEELKKLLTHHGWAPEIVDAHLPNRVPTPSMPSGSGLISPFPASAPAKDDDIYLVSRKKSVWGIILISLPMTIIGVALVGYALSSFIASTLALGGSSAGAASSGLGAQDTRLVMMSFLNVGLGLLGLIGLISFFILVPIGIVLIVKAGNELKPGIAYDERSGKGDASVVPPEIKGWNWGAAFLGFYWGIYYRVWIMFLSFVPVIGSIWWIVMGIMGNQWAWKHNKWLSVDHFKRSQKKWVPWAIVMLILQILYIIGYAYLMITMFAGLAKLGGGGSPLNLNYQNTSGLGLNINALPAVTSGKVVSIGANEKLFNITASDGKEYTVDSNGALSYFVGSTAQKGVAVGDNVVVSGSESSGVIKATSVADYGAANPGQ